MDTNGHEYNGDIELLGVRKMGIRRIAGIFTYRVTMNPRDTRDTWRILTTNGHEYNGDIGYLRVR